MKYAAMLAERMQQHGTHAWLVNTGYTGGKYGVGRRMSLKHTRAIIDAIHDGSLQDVEYATSPIFGLQVGVALWLPACLVIGVAVWAAASQAVVCATHWCCSIGWNQPSTCLMLL